MKAKLALVKTAKCVSSFINAVKLAGLLSISANSPKKSPVYNSFISFKFFLLIPSFLDI